MHVLGLCFAGAPTDETAAMAAFVEDVLGLHRRPIAGVDGSLFGLPDGSAFVVAERGSMGSDALTIGFLVDDLDAAITELDAHGISHGGTQINELSRYVHLTAPDGRIYELVQPTMLEASAR